MTLFKSHVQITALLFSVAISMAVSAGEINKNENKINRAGYTLSNVYPTRNANGHVNRALTELTASVETLYLSEMTDNQQKTEGDWQQRYDTYLHYLKKRRQTLQAVPGFNLPADVQSRHHDFIKLMEQRREIIDQMNEDRRKAFQERRHHMLQKLHQTRSYRQACCQSQA